MAQSIFDKVKKIADGIELWVCMASGIIFVIGFALLTEDIQSTHSGVQTLLGNYDLRVANEITAAALALAPTFGQIVFFYYYLADPSKKQALAVAALLFVFDFASDVFYRTNGIVAFDEKTLVAAAFTLLAFTIGSELFITLGFGAFIKTAHGALDQVEELMGIGKRLFGSKPQVRNQSEGQPQQNQQRPQREAPFTEMAPAGRRRGRGR